MKATTILTLSIVAGLAAVLMVNAHLRKSKGTPVTVFRTTAPIKPGDAIGNRVEQVVFPQNYYPNLLKEAPTADMEQFVKSTPVKATLEAGEIVLYRHLENTVDPGIQDRIPPGMKAISIPVDAVTAVSFFVEPGDVVDVIASIPDLVLGTVSAKPVLQAVTVLAVGTRYRRGEAMRPATEPYPTVTLLVSLEEAEKLTVIRDSGGGGGGKAKFTLLLRNRQDTERVQGIRGVSFGGPDFDSIGNEKASGQ